MSAAGTNTVQQSLVIDLSSKGNLTENLKKAREFTQGLEADLKKAMAAGDDAGSFNSWSRMNDFRKNNPVYSAYASQRVAIHKTIEAETIAAKAKEGQDRKDANTQVRSAAGWAFGGGMGAMVGLGGLSNPWSVERFTKATRDLGAVIGRDLLPYLEQATRLVRWAADAWVNLPQPIRSVIAAVGAAGTVVGGVTLAMYGLSRAAGWLANTSNAATIALGRQAAANTAFGGMGAVSWAGLGRRALPWLAAGGIAAAMLAGGGDNSSYGAAVGNGGMTSPEGYLQELQADVMKSGLSEAQKQTNLLEQILSTLTGIPSGYKDGPTKIGIDLAGGRPKETVPILWGAFEIEKGGFWDRNF